MAINRQGIKGMTEEELRLFRQKQMYDEIRAKQMSDEEYGKAYQQNMYEAYPESAPRGLLDEFIYRNMTTGWGSVPEKNMKKAGIWADQQIDRQEQPDEYFGNIYKEQMELANGKVTPPNMYNPELMGPDGNLVPAWKQGGFWKGWLNEYPMQILEETGFLDNVKGEYLPPAEWADYWIDKQEAERETKRIKETDEYKVAQKREETHQASIWADQQIDRQEAEQAAAKEAEMKAAGIWATDEIVRQETEQLAARRAKEEEMRAAGIWADKAIDAEEKRIVGDISWKGGEGLRTGDLPVTVDTIADRLTEITSPDFTEQNDAYVNSTLEGNGFLGTILEYVGLIEGQGRFEGSEEEELSEEEANNSIAKIAELAEQTKILTEQVKTEVANVKNLTEQVDTEVSGLLANDGGTTDGSGTSSSLLNVPNAANLDVNLLNTTSTSTDGFTIDRLKNPFSKDNKAWWLEKRPGDIPGNNRAVEFFNALAYIGTPLKYRPAKTPSETLQERKIQHLNNLMDYKAASATSDPTFSALRAAVPSYNEIKDVITPRLTEAFDFGWWGKSDEEKNSLEGQITAAAAEIRARMIAMAMAGQTSTVEQEMAKLIKEAKEAEEARKAAEAAKKAAERAAKDDNDEPGIVDKAMTVFKGFF